MKRRWKSMVCFKKTKQSANEWGAIRSNLNLDIRRGHRNQLRVTRGNQTGPECGPKLDLFFCSHENRTVRYRIVPIFGSLFRTAQFLDLFRTDLLILFPYPCERNPSPYHISGRNGTVRTGLQSYQSVCVAVKSGIHIGGITFPLGIKLNLKEFIYSFLKGFLKVHLQFLKRNPQKRWILLNRYFLFKHEWVTVQGVPKKLTSSKRQSLPRKQDKSTSYSLLERRNTNLEIEIGTKFV